MTKDAQKDIEAIKEVQREAQNLVLRRLRDRIPALVPSIMLEVAARLAVKNGVWREAFNDMADIAYSKANGRRR